jgi:hypothetical protein
MSTPEPRSRRPRLLRHAAALALLLTAPLVGAAAQQPAAAPAPQVMILGTPHLGGSGDFVQTHVDDVLAERRQREMEALVERLAEFRPTRIAVEVPVALDSTVNAQYRAYLAGTHAPRRSEIDQIAFRLARRLGHQRLYAVDYKKDEDIRGLFAYAAATKQDAGLRAAQAQMMAVIKDREQRRPSMTMTDILREANAPPADAMEGLYLLAAPVGDAARYVGADLVAGRYERNLKIFANIARIAQPGERVLVLYGAGHGKLLRQLVEESPALDLVRADAFHGPRATSR